MPCEGAHDTVNDWQTTIDDTQAFEGCPRHRSDRTVTSAARQSSSRASLTCYLILQPAALLLLPDLCNSILLVADNSRQLKDVMMVSSCSVSTLME